MFRPLNVHDLVQFYRSEFSKGAGTLGTSATNYVNTVFGALLWRQVNTRANALSILPSVDYPHSGWRAVTANPSTKSNIVVSSESDLGTSVFPDVVTLSTRPYVLSQKAEITDILEALASKRDDVAMEASVLRIQVGQGFINAHNQQILHPITETKISGAWTSLDFIVSKEGELGTHASWLTAGNQVVFGVNRNTNSWANAYVNQKNAAADPARALTKDLLLTLLTNARSQGAEPTCWLTHPNTISKIQSLFEQNVFLSIVGEKQVKVDVNGISSYDGYGVGLTVSTLFGYPIIPDAFVHVPNSELGYVYLLSFQNEQGIGAEIAKSFLIPYMTYESRDIATMNSAIVRVVYRTAGDLVCRRFNIQGKLRDIA